MATRAVYITITPGTPRTHIWCDRCLTRAAIEIPLHTMDDRGVSLIGTWHGCTRCDKDT